MVFACIWPTLSRERADRHRDAALAGDRDGYWEGRLSSFPVGTTASFHPGVEHGFFVVHLPDGRLLALTDRSNHLGQRVYWSDPLPYWGVAGFMDHDYGSAYRANGERLGGPARRALDPYPLTIVDDRLRIAGRAACPTPTLLWESWCR